MDVGRSKESRSYDAFLAAALTDIESFWAAQYPALYGAALTPLAHGIYAAYPSRPETIPGCGTRQTTYADVQGNAFYCDQSDFIVYDDEQLLPELATSLGPATIGIVFAHEFGHAIQSRAGTSNQPTILREQQADCFAGAWAAHVRRGENPAITFSDDDIRQGLIAMIQVRDPLRSAGLADPNAHGSGFDRVGAFQDGFVGGTARCATFFTEDRTKNLVDIAADANDVNQGNLPLVDPSGAGNDIVTLIPKDLDRFWSGVTSANGVTFSSPTVKLFTPGQSTPTCAGVEPGSLSGSVTFCAATNQILVDQTYAQRLSSDRTYGDMSVGSLIGDAFAEAVLQASGNATRGAQRTRLIDCWTGAWTRDDIPPLPSGRSTTDIRLSAGDLDEAVVTTIARSDAMAGTSAAGSAFDRIAAFRAGVLGGLGGCQQYGG